MGRIAKGFSMLELLVVVVIIGIVGAVSATFFTGSQAASVKGTLSGLTGALTEARSAARSTGRTVTVQTSGVQTNLAIAFPSQGDILPVPAGQVLTVWLRQAAGRDATRFAGIASSGAWPILTQAAPAPNPLAGDVPAITALFTNGVVPGPAANLFKGTADASLVFDASGRANGDFWVYVGGMRNGASYPTAPVGLVLVTRANGIHAFFKPNAANAAAAWQRL